MAAGSITSSLSDDPFFSVVLLYKECVEEAILYTSGSSVGEELVAIVRKLLKDPLQKFGTY